MGTSGAEWGGDQALHTCLLQPSLLGRHSDPPGAAEWASQQAPGLDIKSLVQTWLWVQALKQPEGSYFVTVPQQ